MSLSKELGVDDNDMADFSGAFTLALLMNMATEEQFKAAIETMRGNK